MTGKTALFVALSCSLVACDLFGTEEEEPMSAEDTGEPSGEAESGEEESGEEESGGEDSSGEDSGGEDSSGGDSSGEDSSSGGAGGDPPPAEIVGSWYTGNGDTHLEELDLFTDGTYQEDRNGEVTDGGCLTRYDIQLSGEYTVDGDTLTLHATSSHVFLDECGNVQESEELPADGVFEFHLGADVWGYTLRLTPEAGGESVLYHRL